MADELRIEYIRLSELKKYHRNPKDHDLGLLHESIARFGFKDPMAIDEASGELVEGHGRLDTLAEREREGESLPDHMKVVDGEWAAPVIRGLTFANDAERRAYTIAHNRTTEMGGWHEELLLDELKRLAEADVPFDGIGYDADDLDRMLADADFQMPESEPPAIAPTRHGVTVTVANAEAEDELAGLLAAHGYAVKRLSGGE